MGVLGGVRFLMSEVALYSLTVGCSGEVARQELELQRVSSTYQQENCVGLRLRAWVIDFWTAKGIGVPRSQETAFPPRTTVGP